MDQLKAHVKAAAWGMVALVGLDDAIRALESVIAELRNSQWEGPGNR